MPVLLCAREREKVIHRYYEWRLIKRERARGVGYGGERRVLGLALNLEWLAGWLVGSEKSMCDEKGVRF